jgi:hypothetical protein
VHLHPWSLDWRNFFKTAEKSSASPRTASVPGGILEVIENSVTFEPLISNPWTGQLDHFLFNSDSGTSIKTKDKVEMAMKMLREHFDIVMVEGKDVFFGGISQNNRIVCQKSCQGGICIG